MKIGMRARTRMCHTDQNVSASTETVNRVPRPVRKISTLLMPPMYAGLNENKSSFWKLLLTSEKPVPHSPVMYFQFSL